MNNAMAGSDDDERIRLQQAQKLEAIGTLAGGIARDFNNILAHIAGHLELARAEAELDGAMAFHLGEIDKAQQRATDLVKRLLMFSNRQAPQRKVLPLTPVIDEALLLLQSALPPNIRVRTQYADHLPPVAVDALQVSQAILNLGTNAAHAMRAQGGDLTVSVQATTVTADALPAPGLQPGPHLHIAVRDTGSGMPPEVVARVFEPFFTTKGAEGTGLGLPMVHGILRDHDGAITLESEPGVGTTFHIYLPAIVQATAAAPAQGNDDLVLGHGQHVMYVDDEEGLIFLMKRMLSRLKYRCTAFSDPHEALEAFRAAPDSFDGVLTDLAMPGMTGVQLVEAIRAIRPEVRVAVVTGYDQDDLTALDEAGISIRLNKPTPPPELGRALQAMFQD